jgi:hypothetical protein
MNTQAKIHTAYTANLAAGMDAKTAAITVAADMVVAAMAAGWDRDIIANIPRTVFETV